MQKQRQKCATNKGTALQFFDRSPICTYALALYLNFKPSKALIHEIKRIEKSKIYQKEVFFIENLRFCKASDARKISFEESLVFEKIHVQAYVQFGFECIKIPAGPLLERAQMILKFTQ